MDAARTKLSALITANPHDLALRLLMGNVEERAGNLGAATENYRTAVEMNDQNMEALNNLAFLLADSGHADEAWRLAQKAQELAPDNAMVEDTLGWVLFRKGLYSSAIPHLKLAVSKEPTDRRKSHLALAYIKSGDVERGRRLLASVLTASPELLKEPFLREFMAEGLSRPR